MYAIRDSEFIGQRIRQLREQAGLSQSEVGALLDVSYQQIQKYERGVNRISVEKLQQLAQILMVPMAAFFEDTPPSATPQDQVQESHWQYRPFPLSGRERDLLQWFRAIQDEELRVCLATFMKLAAQMQRRH